MSRRHGAVLERAIATAVMAELADRGYSGVTYDGVAARARHEQARALPALVDQGRDGPGRGHDLRHRGRHDTGPRRPRRGPQGPAARDARELRRRPRHHARPARRAGREARPPRSASSSPSGARTWSSRRSTTPATAASWAPPTSRQPSWRCPSTSDDTSSPSAATCPRSASTSSSTRWCVPLLVFYGHARRRLTGSTGTPGRSSRRPATGPARVRRAAEPDEGRTPAPVFGPAGRGRSGSPPS